MWHVYLLRCNDGSFYCGICTNLERRVKEHNTSLKGAKYTRARRPVELVWHRDDMANRSVASKEEYRIKHLTRLQKVALIKSK
ncbi:hypothetical protein FGO68_gene3852 [Halteria grandinella]|uniref:GIY-YIG domain-containing protein n=1 Tax=Halteria grandinella TaxID=5974 RepID=A0A8J8NY83_HALGN|nr:hypothetical protein FGO68_gene3852 [Halteria grandinella]